MKKTKSGLILPLDATKKKEHVVTMQDEQGNNLPLTMGEGVTDDELYREIIGEERTYPFETLNAAELQEASDCMWRLGFKKSRITAEGKIFIESPFFFNILVNAYQMRKINVLYKNDEPVLEEIKENFVPKEVIAPKNPSFARHKYGRRNQQKLDTKQLAKSGMNIKKMVVTPNPK